MTPEEIAAKEAATAAAKVEADAKAKAEADAASADPLKKERERLEKKEPRTEAEKAAYTLKKNAERAKELGLDPASILGVDQSSSASGEDGDDKPVTVGMLRKLEAERSQKTSLQMAEDIDDEDEREVVKHHLEHTIRPSGNPQEDLKSARALANSVRNGQIAEEASRRSQANQHRSGGAPGKHDGVIELTAEERAFTKAPFNLTPEQIVKTRRS